MSIFSPLMRGVAASLLALTVGAGAAYAETVNLTLLGVGDIYVFDGLKTRGGFARLNAIARAERAKGGNFFYAFDGDMLSPSLLSGLDKGANTIELTNIVPFDIAVPGNHEFDFGTKNFQEKVAISKYPWAAINMTLGDGSPVPNVGNKPFIKDYGNLKVGVVPVVDDSYSAVSSTDDWKFGEPIAAAMAAAKDLRKQGADLIVGVVQLERDEDLKLMQSHAFDVILSGDDHDFANMYDGVTAYVETSIDGSYLTLLDLKINIETKDGKRDVKWEPNFHFIDTATVTPDPDTQKIVDGYKKKLSDELNVVIGKTVNPLDSRRNVVRRQESAMGNLIADAIRSVTKADIAIINGGGIRADKQYEAGQDLTRKDIFTELPFGNSTAMIELTGKDVVAALENGVSLVQDGAGRFPQVSGLTVKLELTKPAGSRVVSVMVGDKPIDPAASYKLATNDYMVGGGDGYTVFKSSKVIIGARDGHLLATDVIDYVTAKKTIDVKVEGRIVQ